MITYVFRKRAPTVFSIEKLFDALYTHLEKSGEDIRLLELPHISSGIVSVLRNAWFVARQRNKGTLHITGDVHYAGMLCPFTRTIVTIHDCVVLQRGTGLKRVALWILWFWLPVRLASVVTVISEQTKREVLETVTVPDSKIVVIPNFVDSDLTFKPRAFADDRPRILHVGTTPNKNLERVVAALRDVPCTLVIVGRISPALLTALEAGCVNYENFIGLGHAQLRDLYWSSDVISFPSTYEGFGMPILEGQVAGRPVLTSNREPMRSIAGRGGAVLVDPESVGSIREGFLALMSDDRLRARLVVAGGNNCRRFTLEAVAAGYLALYRQVDAH